MTVLHPILLSVGLGLVAVPILIHILMRRKRKPVPWGAMRFLLEAYKTQRRRMTLEQMLLLAARCLLIALIALAVARPMLGGSGALGTSARTLVVLLDNSITSDLREGDQSALERHKAIATAALERLDPARGDRAALITLGAPARALALPPTADIAGVMRAIEAVEPTDSAPDMLGAAETLASVLDASDDNAPPVSVLVASEFRAGQGVGRSTLPDLGESVEALLATPPPSPTAANIAIEGLEPMRQLVVAQGALGSGQARVALRRSGEAIARPALTSVRLVSDADPSLLLGEGQVRWSAGQSQGEALVTLDADALTRAQQASPALVIRAEIDPDPLGRDNTRRRALEVRESIRVGVAAPGRYTGAVGVEGFSPSDWLRLALSPGEGAGGGIELDQLEPGVLDASQLTRLDALLIPRPDLIDDGAWTRIGAFVRAGGLVVATPPPGEGAQLWTDRLTRALGLRLTIEREARNYESPMSVRPGEHTDASLLSMIEGELEFLAQPVRVNRILPISLDPQSASSVRTLLELEDGAPLIVESAPADQARGRGLVVLFAAPIDPDWSDLPTKPLLVPLLQEIVRQGVGRARGSHSAVAGVRVSAPPGSVELSPLTPGATLGLDEQGVTREAIRTSGAWRGVDQRGGSRGALVVNPDTSATLADPEDPARVARWLAPLAPETELTWITEAGEQLAEANTRTVAQALDAPRRGLDFAWMIFAGVLGLAILELVLARWCSHAELRDAAPIPARAGA